MDYSRRELVPVTALLEFELLQKKEEKKKPVKELGHKKKKRKRIVPASYTF